MAPKHQLRPPKDPSMDETQPPSKRRKDLRRPTLGTSSSSILPPASIASPASPAKPISPRKKGKGKEKEMVNAAPLPDFDSIDPAQSDRILNRYFLSLNPGTAPPAIHYTYEIALRDSPDDFRPWSRTPNATSTEVPNGCMFRATMHLPSACRLARPVPVGLAAQSLKLARRHARLQAIRHLVSLGQLNPDFTPTSSTRSPAPERDPDAVLTQKEKAKLNRGCKAMLDKAARVPPTDGTGVGTYPHILTAPFWVDAPRLGVANLWATVLQLRTEVAGECRAMVLLSSKELALWEVLGKSETQIDVSMRGVAATMTLVRGRKMKRLDEEQLQTARGYTERVMRASMNKPFVLDPVCCRWLVLPLRRRFAPKHDASDEADAGGVKVQRRDIAWDEVAIAASEWSRPLDVPSLCATPPANATALDDDVLLTYASEFGRRLYPLQVRHDLTATSPHPSDPTGKTILENLASPKYPLSTLKYPDQPIIEAAQALTPRHGGFIAPPPAAAAAISYLVPELVSVHALPASVYRTATALPLFLYNLNDLLVAHHLSTTELFSPPLQPKLALQAISPPKTDLAVADNYERLEFLGDTLLKFLTTVYLYAMPGTCSREFADEGDGGMSRLRSEMVSNGSLRGGVVGRELVKYIRSGTLRYKEWVSWGWKVIPSPTETAGEGAKEGENAEGQAAVGDKPIADVAESLIAAAYLSAGRDLDVAIAALHLLQVPIKGFRKWADLQYTPSSGAESLSDEKPAAAGEQSWMKAFKGRGKVLGHKFRDESSLNDALCLTGDSEQRKRKNKLNVLGDALLDYLVIEELWLKYPNETPSSITEMRHARNGLVPASALASSLGLPALLQDLPPDVSQSLKRYLHELAAAKLQVDKRNGTTKGDGPGNIDSREYWNSIAANTIPAQLLQAIMAAILIDSKFDLAPLRAIYTTHLLPFYERYCAGPGGGPNHPKAILYERMFARGCKDWGLRVAEGGKKGVCGALLRVHGQVVSRGEGGDQIIAERKACEEALRRVDGEEKILERICLCPVRKRGV